MSMRCTILTSLALALALDLNIGNVVNNNAPKRLHATAVVNGFVRGIGFGLLRAPL